MAHHLDDHQVLLIMHETTPRPLLLLLLVIIITPLVLLLLLLCSSSNDGGDKVQPQASNKTTSTKKNPILPPSPPGLPIIGHLHLIRANPYVSLRDLAARYGNGGLAMLRLGTVPNLVVSSPRAARAILRTHDHTFASRPTSTLTDALLYGSSDVAFSPYGEHWRQLKKIVTAHLFTTKKVRSFRDARQQEVRLVMAKIRRHENDGTAVDVGETVDAFTNDVVCRAVSGKFFPAEGRNRLFRELIEMNNSMFGGFSLLEDYYPWVARSSLTSWLVRGKAREGHKRWDDLLEKIITDHESRRSSASDKQEGAISEQPQDESDFIDVLLSVQQEYGISRDNIKAILMDMFAAGTDTSSSVLQFAMAELMRIPDLMTKLQTEVRNNTPEGQEMVAEENLATMSYLRAVVKETLRLHPPAPLLLPHLSISDCEILDGYTVPAGTRVVVNAWAIGRDPESWETKPEEFMPERFLVMDDGGIDFKGNDFRFLPFGAGQRICPGLNFGLATVEIMLANLVYCFDWELPDGMEKEDIDMTELFGLTIHRKEKLHLVPKPRGSAADFL